MDNETKILRSAAAVKTANPQRFELPKDLDALARMKDQLDRHLQTLESNTESLSNWLNNNKETIILGYYRLHRALRQKDQATAIKTLQNLFEAAGFVLSIDNFADLSAAAFGDNSAFMTEARKHSEPFPSSVLQPLPGIYVPQVELGIPPDVQGEMNDLTSDKYYFIDSTMEFIGAGLDPDPNVRPDDETMLQYRHPQFIIDRAYEDFEQVNLEKGSGIRRMAGIYAKIAGAFQTQASLDEMKDGIATLSAGEKESQEELMRNILFRDFDFGSFAELALKKIKDPQLQVALFAEAVKHEKKIVFKDTQDQVKIFHYLFNRVLDGMDSSVLRVAQKPLGIVDHASAIKIYDTHDSVFSYAVDKYINQPEKLKTLLKDMLAYAENKVTNDSIESFVQLLTAVKSENFDAAADIMTSISNNGQTLAVKSLWKLSNRASLMYLGENNPAFLQAGLRGGFFDQASLSATSSAANIDNLLDFINTTFIKTGAHPDLLREFISTAFQTDGTVELRKRLNSDWIETITKNDNLTDAQKTQMIAVLLSPFKSDIIRANILWEASENTTAVKIADKLVTMEQALVGQNIRLGSDRMLINVGNIANIWYDSKKGRECLCYNIDGNAAVMTEKISTTEAGEILALIARRGPFLQEYGGLFNPKNFDKFVIKQDKVSYFRNTVSCDLNLTKESDAINALKRHKNYVLLEDYKKASSEKSSAFEKQWIGYNLNSVAMILVTGENSCVLIDKFGEYTHVTGSPKGLDGTQMLEVTAGTYINPDNFSVIGFNKATSQIGVKVEGKKFLQFIQESGQEDSNIYKISVTPARLKTLETALSSQANNNSFYKADGAFGKTGFNHFFFNFQRLGYITRVSTDKNAGKIFYELSQNSNLILLGKILIHPDFINEAYYNSRTTSMHILTPSGWLEVEKIAAHNADALLQKLKNMPGFLPAGEKKVAGGHTVVGDVVNMQDVSLIQKDPHDDQTLMTFASQQINAAVTRTQADGLFDAFENTDPATIKTTRAELRKQLSAPAPAYTIIPLGDTSSERLLENIAQAPALNDNINQLIKNIPKKNKKKPTPKSWYL